MNCPVCHAEMVMDYKIKIENGMLFNLVTIKKKNDQKKNKGGILPFLRQDRTVRRHSFRRKEVNPSSFRGC